MAAAATPDGRQRLNAAGGESAFAGARDASHWTGATWRALIALGADRIPHAHGSLALHLRGTAELLERWGNRDALCIAGSYHAIYGTHGFQPALASIAARSRIAEIIGAEAESIVYRYGSCDRDLFHPRIGGPEQLRLADRFARSEHVMSEPQLRDFCELTFANELELASAGAMRPKRRTELTDLFERMRDCVSAPAFAAYRRAMIA